MKGTTISLRTAVLISIIGFAAITLATALVQPLVVARFYPPAPDQGPAWYFWKLPQTSSLIRVTYWLGYAMHQIVVVVLLLAYRGERAERGRVSRANIAVLAVNLAFIALHLVQTALWYDGLAQDVPIWSSQGSVIVMLVLILFLEMPRRGLFWGAWRNVPQKTYGFVRRWHGIYITWAVVYTFWFHPMDGNWGLLSGFIYMFLLFVQMSLFNTSLHSNRAWVVLLEAFVVVHATLITVYKNNPIWPMFMVGFLVMFVVTQQHGLRLPSWAKAVVAGVFVAGVAALYVLVRGVEHAFEIAFIPVALYGGAIGLWAIGHLVDNVIDGVSRRSPDGRLRTGSQNGAERRENATG